MAKLYIRLTLTTEQADILQDTLQIGADNRIGRTLQADSEAILSIFHQQYTQAAINRAKTKAKARKTKERKAKK